MTEILAKKRPVIKVHRKKGTGDGGVKKHPVIKVHRKKKKKTGNEDELERKAGNEGDHISLSVNVVSRTELKRSRTMNEMEDDENIKQILELRYQELILREKSEALVAENEAKNIIITGLEARVSELEGRTDATVMAQLQSAQQEAKQWEVEARRVVDEGNAAIEEAGKQCADMEARYTMLHNAYEQMRAKNRKTSQDVDVLKGMVQKREVLLEEQKKKILQLRDNSGEVMLLEQASIQMLEEREARLVASMAALEETQKRCSVYKRRLDKAEADLVTKEKEVASAALEIKDLKKKDADWTVRWGNIEHVKATTMPVTGPDESAEISRVKASNMALELKLLTADTELKETKKQLYSIQAEVKNIVSQRDDMKRSRDDVSKSVGKKNERLEDNKKTIESLKKEMGELKAKYHKMHNDARAREDVSRKAAVEAAHGDYTRSQIELMDLQENYKEVCKELEVLKMTGTSGQGDAQKELSEYKRSYAKIVDSNKRWEVAYKEVAEKNAAWKAAEISWMAKLAKAEEKLVEASQIQLVLEHKVEKAAPDEYVSIAESTMCVFISNFEETMSLLSSSGFKPNPILAQVFADFPSFKRAAEELMANRARGGEWNKEAFDVMSRFLFTDLSKETQSYPLAKMVSVYHVTIAALQSYCSNSRSAT